MKLVVCIIHDNYSKLVEEVLNFKGYRMTELATSGNFSRMEDDFFVVDHTGNVNSKMK
ncbi:uncharacterized protein YaaQ [Texcoconibacillus texcoconensis]|uniref:Uncharacterized protein YaaQ n=1 Tax=Texcoconibacillus texcoconensis TaxID=1095777 RepID=A0A840QUU7_9BACI|nr:cyclic-di-AMP receptor [Texcoconibacillus texcoconensis]MBB5175073.1 uncharacterized protein YaaQ [Texcoconibacillus texcoconensis]